MKAKHLSFIVFWLCFFGTYSVNAADEKIINGQVDKNAIKMVQGQLSNSQSINIKGSPGINLVNNTANSNITHPALQPAKPATHGASIIDKSNMSKKYFELSHQTPRTAWRKKNITGAQSMVPKTNIIPSKKLQDMETKRKKMKESRKKELESKLARKLLKPNPNGKDNAP